MTKAELLQLQSVELKAQKKLVGEQTKRVTDLAALVHSEQQFESRRKSRHVADLTIAMTRRLPILSYAEKERLPSAASGSTGGAMTANHGNMPMILDKLARKAEEVYGQDVDHEDILKQMRTWSKGLQKLEPLIADLKSELLNALPCNKYSRWMASTNGSSLHVPSLIKFVQTNYCLLYTSPSPRD